MATRLYQDNIPTLTLVQIIDNFIDNLSRNQGKLIKILSKLV